MLDRLIRLSLANRLTVALLAALMLVFGGLAIRGLPIDVFPDLNRPTVTLLTESHGLSPEEVEVLVSRPLELAMNGAPGVHRVRSQSAPGLSVVWVEFGWDVDIWRARQQVSERLASASAALPERVRPNLGPVSSIMGEILLVGLASHEGAVAGPELRRYADLTLRPRLLSLPGVAEVVTIGGGVEQIEVAVRPETLAARGVPLRVVTDAAALASGATTGGFVERKSQEYLVRNLARTSDPEAIAATPLGVLADGVALTLGDVATVRRAVAPMRGDAGVNAHPGVILSVQKQPGTSTFELDAAVAAALADLSPPGDVEIEVLFRQADFIGAAVANVEEALRDGALLVVLVLVPFLMSWRTTAITLTAIPLSFVTAALVLHGLGMSLDTMTLGGLAVAVGELVDDAIVDVENVWRRLRENHDAGSPRAALDVVADASSEIRGSVVFSTVLVVLVFVPLFSLSGIEGRLFVPLGVAYVTSILASLVVSLTVTPVLCSWLLPGALGRSNAHSGDGWLVRRLKAWDRALLARVLPRPWAVLGVVAWLTLGAALSVPWLGTSFLPAFHEGTATISMIAAPGTSLAESNRMGALAERLLLDVPEVERVGRRTGRAERDEHAEGVHYTELDVDFAPEGEGRPRDVVLAEVRAQLARIPGVGVSVGQPISHRLDHLLSGVRAEIVVKLFGDDLPTLRAEAERLAARLETVPGLVDLQVERQVLVPQVQIRVDRERARRFGLAPGALTEDLETALGGRVVGQVYEGLRALDLVVRFDEAARGDVDAIAGAPIALTDGRVVTLGQVADVERSTGPNQILHEGGRRRIVVSANTADRPVGDVVGDVQAILREHPPAGVDVVVSGQHESQREATRRIFGLAAVALLGMYAVLYTHLGQHRLVLQVLINVPLALVGAVAALWLGGATMSIATLIGFVTLTGIATRNTILMITHYDHLHRVEGLPFGTELVVRGSLERLSPVLMTALSTGLSLIPLALAAGEPGKEILSPVALVILGGLVSSTLLDMLVTPTLYLHFSRPEPR